MRTGRHRGAFAAAVLAGAALLLAPAPAAAQRQQAGVTAAVRGTVELAERPGAVGRLVTSGEPVFLGNAIKSGADSGLQLMLLDETTFTIGPNSEVTIDEFVYDPRSSAGKVTASVAKGVFRFVTGKVAQQNPTNMTVRLPTGNIGIRGTIALGRVDQVLQDGRNQPYQQVILIGPGAGREGENRRGGLMLSGGNPGDGIEIWRPGFGSEMVGGRPWSPPAIVPQAVIQAYLNALRTGRAQLTGLPSPDPGNAGRDAQVRALQLQELQLLNQNLILSSLQFGADTQNLGNQSQQRSLLAGGGNPTDGFSTYEQLRTLNTGQFFWSQNNVALDGFSASYNLSLNIDFGNRTVGGGNSRVEINTSMPGSVALATQSFASLSGAAQFNFNNLTGYFDPGVCEVSCMVDVKARPVNSGGTVGQTLQHSVTIHEDGATVTSGSGTTGPRQAGSAP